MTKTAQRKNKEFLLTFSWIRRRPDDHPDLPVPRQSSITRDLEITSTFHTRC